MKDDDINDTLRTYGVDAARARHDEAELFNSGNPKDQNGKVNGSRHGISTGTDDPSIPDLSERDAGDDIELPRPRRWLLGNQFCRTFLSGLVAPGVRERARFGLLNACR
jgi:hypothetical protein